MTTRNRITTAVVVTLGLAAGATPAFARSFDINANGSYVPAGSATMHSHTAGPAHHHHPRERR